MTTTDSHNVKSKPATVTITVKNVNIPPVANAGVDQIVNENSTVVLLGNKSRDPDGKIVSYLWKQTAEPPVVLSKTNISNPAFIAPSVVKNTRLN